MSANISYDEFAKIYEHFSQRISELSRLREWWLAKYKSNPDDYSAAALSDETYHQVVKEFRKYEKQYGEQHF